MIFFFLVVWLCRLSYVWKKEEEEEENQPFRRRILKSEKREWAKDISTNVFVK